MSRYLLAIAILALVAACKIGGDETHVGAADACAEVGAACAADADCCSYGCVAHLCAPNPNEGGTCRTTPDCVSGRLCKSGACVAELSGMCRDTADVCTSGYGLPGAWGDCCSGNCEGGRCTVNQPPTASIGANVVGGDPANAPYTKLVQITDASFDADADPLTRSWYLTKPAGSAAVLSASSPPSFTPDKEGVYVVRLVVTEGPTGAPDRHVVEDSVTINAVNLPPVASVTFGDTALRNVAFELTGSASDADGDAVDCTWRVTAPGAASAQTFSVACGAPTHVYTPASEGPYVAELVVADHDQTTGAVRHTVVATGAFTSINVPPTPVLKHDPQSTQAPYWANVGGPTPVTLDATLSSDENRDTIGFAWAALTWPDKAEGGTAPSLDPVSPGVVRFTPTVAGDYTFQLTVSDPPLGERPSASASTIAVVKVERAVFDLGAIEITDADVAHGAVSGGRIVLVGPDPSDTTKQKGMLWVVDLATPEYVGLPIALGQKPTVVGVSPDGTVAVAASASFVYVVPLDGSAHRVHSYGGVSDVVVTGPDQGGKRRAYVFFSSATSVANILDIGGADSWSSAGVYGSRGSLDTVGDRLYVRDPSSIRKYTIGGNGSLGTAIQGSYSGTNCPELWASRKPQSYVFTGCGDVLPVPATATSLSVSQPLDPAVTRVTHLDTATDGQGVYVGPDPLVVNRFSSSLTSETADVIPRWSWDGQERFASARFAFTDGTTRWAIVTGAPGGSARPGLVTFAPPPAP